MLSGCVSCLKFESVADFLAKMGSHQAASETQWMTCPPSLCNCLLGDLVGAVSVGP